MTTTKDLLFGEMNPYLKQDDSGKFVGEKRYRSKEGATGKTSNTIQWSSEMQNCFDRKK